MFFIFFIAFFLTSYMALNELRKTHPKEYELIGGIKTTYSHSSKLNMVGYFLAFEYRRYWCDLTKKYIYVAATISTWSFFSYGIWYLIDLL